MTDMRVHQINAPHAVVVMCDGRFEFCVSLFGKIVLQSFVAPDRDDRVEANITTLLSRQAVSFNPSFVRKLRISSDGQCAFFDRRIENPALGKGACCNQPQIIFQSLQQR